MDEPVVVCGATGTVGSRLVARLVERGVKVRGVARHPGHYSGPQGVELVDADLRDPAQAEKVLEGAGSVYLTPPETGNHPIQNERSVAENVINAAAKHKVKHLIIHTVVKAKQGNTGVRIIDNKKEIERLVKASGVPYTILRPGWFLQNLAVSRDEIEKGILRIPLPERREFAGVSAADVAEAAARFLQKGPQNRGFDVHVEGGVSCGDLSEAASETVGRAGRFEESRLEELLERQAIETPRRELVRERWTGSPLPSCARPMTTFLPPRG